jgi:hypothetical protein
VTELPGRSQLPREWNLWELERLAQQHASDDEEIAFLLFYLREFADSEGVLPVQFDSLVRDAFSGVLRIEEN